MVMTPGVWELGYPAATITRGWFTRANNQWVPLPTDDDFTYTPTANDYEYQNMLIWLEVARRDDVDLVRIIVLARTWKLDEYRPRYSSVSSEPLGGYAAGATLTRQAINWTDPLAELSQSTLVISDGEWIKNDVPTGVTTDDYSDTVDGDVVLWRETATNIAGTATAESLPRTISTIHEVLRVSVVEEIAQLIGSNPGGGFGMELWDRDPDTGLILKDHAGAGSYTRNPDLWCDALRDQLTGVVIYNSAYYVRESFGGVLITPRHLLYCDHAHPWPANWGTIFGTTRSLPRFATTDGTPVQREEISAYGSPSNDMCVTLLDAPLTQEADGIGFYPILDIHPNTVLLFSQLFIPRIVVSQGPGRIPHMGQLPPVPAGDYPRYNEKMIHIWQGRWFGAALPIPFPGYHYQVWDGDSGTPGFILYQGILYLIYVVRSSGGGGVLTSGYVDHINGLIAECDQRAVTRGVLDAPTNYTLTVVSPEL